MKILGHNYRVILTDHNRASELGKVNHGNGTIQLRDDLAGDCKMSTLLHEIVHTIDFQLNTEMEENNIGRMATGLYQVLVDNGVSLKPLLRGIK